MSARVRFGPLSLAVALGLGIVAAAVAATGDLDPTFGNGGSLAVSPYVENAGDAAALQPDGKILLAGWADDVVPPPPPPSVPFRPQRSNPDFLAVRLTPNGSLDPSFGSGGTVRTPIDLGNSSADRAHAVAPGPGGTVVLAGDAVTSDGGLDFAFVRYTSTGGLDASFSGDGIQTVDNGRFDHIGGVAVQPDGKIVGVGRGGGDGDGFSVIRLLASGVPDMSFGTRGIVNTAIRDRTLPDQATAVLLVGGKIVVAGMADWPDPSRNAFALVRYLSNGQLDRSFGTGGIAVARSSFDQVPWALAAAPGSKIVVTGQSAGDFRVARYLATGAPDRTFGGQGFAITSFDGLYAHGRGVAVQADGKIVVGGMAAAGQPGSDGLAVARYNLNGSLDSSFGTNGKRTYPIAATVSGGASVLQRGAAPGGGDRLVVAGTGSAGSGMAHHVVAIGVDLGRPGPPSARCRVPRVIHLRFGLARRKINRAHCSVGRIRFVRRPRFARLVVAQSPRAGKVLRPGGRVNLVLGRS